MNYKVITIFVVINLLVIGGIIIAYQSMNRPQVGESYPILNSPHIAKIGDAHEPYNSNPPTSGPHYKDPANRGIYKNQLADEQLVHNLEHGYIWISYKDIDGATLKKLEDIADQYSNKLILEPRAQNDSPIVLASWGHLEKLQSFDEKMIVTFIESNKEKSPEPNAQ